MSRYPSDPHAPKPSLPETVYELDIRDDYLFYSNPVSRAPSADDVSVLVPMGGAGGGEWGVDGDSFAQTTSANRVAPAGDFESATLARQADKTRGKGRDKNAASDRPHALNDPFVRKQLSSLKTHYPYFLTIVTTGQVVAMIVSFILNAKTTGSPIETNPFNYMIGPTSGTLIAMGGRFVPCMKSGTGFDKANLTFVCPSGIQGSLTNGTVCTLLDLCTWGGFPSGKPDQWFRFFVPIALHAGVVHILFNLSFQVQTGFQLEKDMGWWRMAIIYIGSGVGGFLFGAGLSDVRVPSVGASGSLYGMIACLLLDLIQNWSLIKHPWIELFKMLANIIFSFMIGMLPYIDNFAHVGGFVTGLPLGILFMPKIYFSKWDRRRKLALMVLSLPALVVFFALVTKGFYDNTMSCTWCKYFNCIPGLPWCSQKFDVVTSIGT
nr:hypothetical protein HK105_006070 [Polyrhizophydium stewartii]